MTGHLPADVERELGDVLEQGEEVLGSVTTLAGTLILTERRIVILRSGRGYRPQTGVRAWRISQSLDLSYGWPHGGQGRLILGKGARTISFFVNECDWTDAMQLIAQARAIAYRSGSGGSGSASDRWSPAVA